MFTFRNSKDRAITIGMRSALLGVALLAACDTDKPIAPTTTNVPTAQSALFPIRTGALRMTVVDDQGNLVTGWGATIKLTDSQNNIVTVQDQSMKDGDPNVGRLVLAGLNPGLYTVCDSVPAADYLLGKNPCVTASVSAGVTKDGGTFVNPRRPHVVVSTIDIWNKLHGGAWLAISDSLGAGQIVYDNFGGSDQDPVSGVIKAVVFDQGKHKVCVIQPPTSYHFIPGNTYCATFQAVYGQTQTLAPFVFTLPYVGRWGVTDGGLDINNEYTKIGPSSFTVYNPKTLSWINIDDNGWNDEDKTLGKISMPVPNAGSYSVCEVTPPTNHWNATPNCKTMTVAMDVPAWVGWFINPEKQVIYQP